MSDNLHSDEQIQQIYNATKNLESPTELDSLILNRVRSIEEQPTPLATRQLKIYLPIAASVLIIIFLQFKTVGSGNQITEPIEIVQPPIAKKSLSKPKNAQRNRLPNSDFLPFEGINKKVLPACTANFPSPEENFKNLNTKKESDVKAKQSDIPLGSIYSGDATNPYPKSDSVSKEILKK